jgi:hypothetical protein
MYLILDSLLRNGRVDSEFFSSTKKHSHQPNEVSRSPTGIAHSVEVTGVPFDLVINKI